MQLGSLPGAVGHRRAPASPGDTDRVDGLALVGVPLADAIRGACTLGLDRSVAAVLRDISDGQLTGGGGYCAALTAALAAALVQLVARSGAAGWDGASGAIAQAEVLQRRLTGLASQDVESYTTARQLLSQAEQSAESPHRPKATDDRDYDLAEALTAAAATPLSIAEAAADVAALAASAASVCAPQLRPDALVAACLAQGAADAAADLVAVNLAVHTDSEFASRARAAATAAAHSRLQAARDV